MQSSAQSLIQSSGQYHPQLVHPPASSSAAYAVEPADSPPTMVSVTKAAAKRDEGAYRIRVMVSLLQDCRLVDAWPHRAAEQCSEINS